MARTKKTARPKGYRRKKRDLPSKASQTVDLCAPEGHSADCPICIDITGKDTDEVAGKVRGMLRDLKSKRATSPRTERRRARKARLKEWLGRARKTPQVVIEPGVEIEFYNDMNTAFGDKGWVRDTVTAVDDKLDDPDMIDCRYPLTLRGYRSILWQQHVRVVALKDGTEVAQPVCTTPEDCTLKPGHIRAVAPVDALIAHARDQITEAAATHGLDSLVR